ncbi:hypothetical protein V496_04829 [Pseudogymnoascus sp. VKM F-4515 (FW-2607)]|nr:hypothetical protein V496_04829 [Pseudogymnoascus sp. VKM F-4515 (FW-2607)]
MSHSGSFGKARDKASPVSDKLLDAMTPTMTDVVAFCSQSTFDMEVLVVSKVDNEQHATFTLQNSLAVELPSSSIRVRTLLVSLTSNNLTYARGGHSLHWWDTYPVPTASPTPYNDTSSWGIVPAWGYAVVVESTITSILQGAVLWGYWPTSTASTDLKLQATEPKGHWIEISDHRQKLMHIYNRYIEVSKSSVSLSSPGFGTEELEDMAWNALFRGVWEGAYLLSQHVFSPSPQTQSPIHPLGVAIKWTAADADLSSAMLISLSASSKTARSFAYHLSNRPASAGPLGLLQVTSSPLPISVAAENLQPPYPTRTIAYSEICETLEWMAGLKAFKIVIVDFGARDNILDQLVESMKNHPVLRSCTLAIIQVGSQQKIYTDEDVLATKEEMSRFGKVQYNTSGVQDTVMQLNGAATYFDTVTQLWDQWLRNRHRSIPDMRIVWGKGISGADGIEGGWQRLCQGLVDGGEGLVYRFY